MSELFKTLPDWFQFTLITVPAISAMFAACALILNFGQSKRTNLQSRAALVTGCLNDFSKDVEIQRAFYDVEYCQFKYDATFHKSEKEREIDKLLRNFANLALSWKSGLLTTEDVRPVQYYVLRVMKNAEIGKYMEYMKTWEKNANCGSHPYLVLVEFSEALSKD